MVPWRTVGAQGMTYWLTFSNCPEEAVRCGSMVGESGAQGAQQPSPPTSTTWNVSPLERLCPTWANREVTDTQMLMSPWGSVMKRLFARTGPSNSTPWSQGISLVKSDKNATFMWSQPPFFLRVFIQTRRLPSRHS